MQIITEFKLNTLKREGIKILIKHDDIRNSRLNDEK
jgi:hypothetical protein